MKRLFWSPASERDLQGIETDEVSRIAAALGLYALTGAGTLVRFPSLPGEVETRVYVPPEHRWYATVKVTDEAVYVERVLESP